MFTIQCHDSNVWYDVRESLRLSIEQEVWNSYLQTVNVLWVDCLNALIRVCVNYYIIEVKEYVKYDW